MKHLIGVAFALAISTPSAMGEPTEVVIPQGVLENCDMYSWAKLGTCDIKPDERRVILTKSTLEYDLWDLCPVEGIAPGWRLEIINLDHTRVYKCRM